MSQQSKVIVTISFFGRNNLFQLTQNEFSFDSVAQAEIAESHFLSDEFRSNIEAAGAFAKVDVLLVP